MTMTTVNATHVTIFTGPHSPDFLVNFSLSQGVAQVEDGEGCFLDIPFNRRVGAFINHDFARRPLWEAL